MKPSVELLELMQLQRRNANPRKDRIAKLEEEISAREKELSSLISPEEVKLDEDVFIGRCHENDAMVEKMSIQELGEEVEEVLAELPADSRAAAALLELLERVGYDGGPE